MTLDLDGHFARLQQQGYTIIPDFLSVTDLRALREGYVNAVLAGRGDDERA